MEKGGKGQETIGFRPEGIHTCAKCGSAALNECAGWCASSKDPSEGALGVQN